MIATSLLPFAATHVIQTGTRRWYVRAEEVSGKRPGLILYTERGWLDCEIADWWLDPIEGLQFRGSACRASLERFSDCRWTNVDGWNDDGTRGDDE